MPCYRTRFCLHALNTAAKSILRVSGLIMVMFLIKSFFFFVKGNVKQVKNNKKKENMKNTINIQLQDPHRCIM